MTDITPFIYRNHRDLMLGPPPESNFLTRIPPGQYRLNAAPKIGLYLTEYDPQSLPSKVYGDLGDYSRRVVKTFNSRKRTTGVLLKGDKGSGKSLLSQVICRDLVDAGVPVILVNSAYPGQVLAGFLENFKQPMAVFIDEFEKVYDDIDAQQTLLPLMDGASGSNILFILTINTDNISEFLINRPGRVFYTRKFSGLELSFICEFARDKLKDKSRLGDVVLNSCSIKSLSFDGLQAIIEEMNRYNEGFRSANRYLQLYQPGPGSYEYFNFKVEKLMVGGVNINKDRLANSWLSGMTSLPDSYISLFFYENPDILLGGNASSYKVGKLGRVPEVVSGIPSGDEEYAEILLKEKDSYDPNEEPEKSSLDLRGSLYSLSKLSNPDYNDKDLAKQDIVKDLANAYSGKSGSEKRQATVESRVNNLDTSKGVDPELKAFLQENLALLNSKAVVVGFAAARDFVGVDDSTGHLVFTNPKGDSLHLSRVESGTSNINSFSSSKSANRVEDWDDAVDPANARAKNLTAVMQKPIKTPEDDDGPFGEVDLPDFTPQSEIKAQTTELPKSLSGMFERWRNK